MAADIHPGSTVNLWITSVAPIVPEGDNEGCCAVFGTSINAPTLAATGVDSGPLALAAGLLVLGDLAVTAVTARRRVSTQ